MFIFPKLVSYNMLYRTVTCKIKLKNFFWEYPCEKLPSTSYLLYFNDSGISDLFGNMDTLKIRHTDLFQVSTWSQEQ